MKRRQAIAAMLGSLVSSLVPASQKPTIIIGLDAGGRDDLVSVGIITREGWLWKDNRSMAASPHLSPPRACWPGPEAGSSRARSPRSIGATSSSGVA